MGFPGRSRPDRFYEIAWNAIDQLGTLIEAAPTLRR